MPFALCGGYAAWVRGAPEPDHDADFLVRRGRGGAGGEGAGRRRARVQDPPEDWLIKVVSGGSFVDVLWRTCGHPVESDLIDRAEVLPVLSVQMPVLPRHRHRRHQAAWRSTSTTATSRRLLPVARALREQVDWAAVRREVARTTTSPSSSCDCSTGSAWSRRHRGLMRRRPRRPPLGTRNARPAQDRRLTCRQGGPGPPSSPGPVPDRAASN